MTYEDMDAAELRAELHYWHERVAEYAAEFAQAVDAENVAWEAGSRVALDQALRQAKHIRSLLKVGAVA